MRENKTKIFIIINLLAIILVMSGCSTIKNASSESTTKTNNTIKGTGDLFLNAQNLVQLKMMSNGTDCQTENDYSNIVDSTLGQYSICYYNIIALNDTQVTIEFNKFANLEELNGSYQYSSLHLYSIQGLISENDYGDQSRFRINNVNDYMGQLNNPNVTYYHLWICKDTYLIHITSSGSKDAKEYIEKIGRQILLKFG